jgi:hypothetical protein
MQQTAGKTEEQSEARVYVARARCRVGTDRSAVLTGVARIVSEVLPE